MKPEKETLPSSADAAYELVPIGARFYDRGWVQGTSGNFSAVVARDPLRLTITPSAAHKGRLEPGAFLQIDEDCGVVSHKPALPSAEARLHVQIVKARAAGAVLHTHSIWSTILSDRHANEGGLAIEGYEMLKGLDGVTSHEHREWIPIVANDQDMVRLSGVVKDVLTAEPAAHAFLLRQHGLYTWGRTIADAERHVEILEFLFEVIGRRSTAP